MPSAKSHILAPPQAPAVAANPLSDTTTIPALRVMTKPSTSVGATEGYVDQITARLK